MLNTVGSMVLRSRMAEREKPWWDLCWRTAALGAQPFLNISESTQDCMPKTHTHRKPSTIVSHASGTICFIIVCSKERHEVLVLLHGLLLFAPWGVWCGTGPLNQLLSPPPLLAGRAELAEVWLMAEVWLILSPVTVVNVEFPFHNPWHCRSPSNSGVWYLHTWKRMP